MLNPVREGEEDYIKAIRYRRRLKSFENFLFLLIVTFTFRLKRHTSMSAVFHLSVQYAAKYLEPLKYS